MSSQRKIGIKAKVRLGCIVLSAILFFTSLISIYEYLQMNDYVNNLVKDNITSINAARELMAISDNYNMELMYNIPEDEFKGLPDNGDELSESLSSVQNKFCTDEERAAADSLNFAYAAYMQIVREAETIWSGDYESRAIWYADRLQPIYIKFRGYIQNLTKVCEDSLNTDSELLQQTYYRSLMPSFIALIFTILLVFLFNYYLNHYMINPLLKITKGIREFKHFNKNYVEKVDTGDELSELNDEVRDIIDLNKSYKKNFR